jgi:hypothetical protein
MGLIPDRYRGVVARVQIGLRVNTAAVERVELLAKECKVHRVDAIRALLSEALKRQDVVAAARRRLQEDEL